MTSSDSETLTSTFREVMAGVATPVTVVTAMGDAAPRGTTVSAFASLSIRPPMVMVALDRGSGLLSSIDGSRRFGVNVLGSGQSALALRFARKGGVEKFDGVPWQVDNDLPRLPEAPGWLACTVNDLVDGGDHVIVLGEVIAAETYGGAPLTYHSRLFGTHSALTETI